ncbi:HU family DNA-binding protein [Pseudoalteromonas sp.]|uniref:HU family DNA-binding protein n=1 Tax=Pseudoalteromonas sp. TaxID=53249 RepID=UPI003D09EA26
MTKKKAATKKKAVTKKAVAKKSVAKKKSVKKAAAKSASTIKRASKQYTKSELMNVISETSGVVKKDVVAVFDVLADVIEAHVKKGAVGQFTLPGLMKVKTIRKPATKKRKGINPFTGEETIFQAKPARTVVKVLPLKKLKEMV